jgi:predicted dehydrogenase
MADAARDAGVLSFVGFNYLKNPLVRMARDIIRSGELGEIWSFKGWHCEDYMRDAAQPWTWRLDPTGGAGVVADLGSHIISLALDLIGEIDELSADIQTVIKERPESPGSQTKRPVEVDDIARAILHFTNGVSGMIEASWVASGRKLNLAFEISGSKGTIMLDMERLNEIQLYRAGGTADEDGFKTILANAAHPDYAPFCPAPGHQLGFNDVKAIEVKAIIEAMAGGATFEPDFDGAYRVQQVVDTVLRSAAERRWLKVT